MTNKQHALDHVFHALANPTRRAVVKRLTHGSASVSELAKPFKMALPSFLQHLEVLERSGLIRSKKVGRARQCHIQAKRLERVEKWIAKQRLIWEERTDRLEKYLTDLQFQEKEE